MKRFKHYIYTLLLILLSLTTSCIEDGFTYNSNDTLTFSADTIAFDTIFTDLTTPIATLKIFNKSKKQVNISQIQIKGESAAKFFLNVDGVKNETFNNIEIRGGDSIYVFVSAHINPTDDNAPLEYKDKIEFVTNGVVQNIVLTAWGQNVIRLHRAEITENSTFTADRPYVIFDTLHVAKGATLNLEPGTQLYFHDKAGMVVDGTLKANGTQDAPIDFRGDRTDNVVGMVNYDIMSDQWDGIRYTADSYENELAYVYMRNFSNGVTVDSCNVEQRKLHIFNSVLHNSGTNVLNISHAWVDAEGSEFSEAKNSVVSLTGGRYNFTQCTFGNYYLFSAIYGAILKLDYVKDKTFDAPLMSASIDNSIIYGNSSDISIGNLDDTQVMFRNVLFKSAGSDDNNFLNCVWKSDPKFYVVRSSYIFDYRLKNDSEAIGKGDNTLCPESARYDRYGNDRFANGAVDLGAYTWIKSEDEEDTEK